MTLLASPPVEGQHVNNLARFWLACRVAGLPPDSEPDSQQVADALNCALVVRAAFVWQLDLDTATVQDIPRGPEQDLIAALAEEYGLPHPTRANLSALLAKMEQAPLARFCSEHALDPASAKGRALFVADGIPLTQTELNGTPLALAWLRGRTISTVGRLGARVRTLWTSSRSGDSGTRFRKRIEGFLAENPWTKGLEL